MKSKTLSQPSLQMVENYLHLPFENKNISAPYFNNRRAQIRGALRVLIGKGSPQDIVDEARIFSMKEKIDLEQVTDEEIKKYLIEHNLGVDCSGFVYHVLNAESELIYKKSLKQILHFPHAKNFVRKFLVKMRPVENCGVSTFANETNTAPLELCNTKPGDLIIIIGGGPKKDYNHIMIIHEVEYEHELPKIIHYSHSFQWPSDGEFSHGVRQGTIEFTDLDKNILEQKWQEHGRGELDNWTYTTAQNASKIELRRLIR
jgi:hypothetical protein